MVDSQSEEGLINTLAGLNSYGKTYRRILLAHTPEKRTELVNILRNLIKTAGVASIPLAITYSE